MKKFIIIGNLTRMISACEVRDMLLSGDAFVSHYVKLFYLPEHDAFNRSRAYDIDGRWAAYVPGCQWMSNIPNDNRPGHMDLKCKYDPERNPHYDNYDAIEVSSTHQIPSDYYGVMGVPITFLPHWCQDQFKILGVTGPILNGKNMFWRLLIKRRDASE